MNDNIRRAQVTIDAMKLMVGALEDLGRQLPKNPRLFAVMAESPLEDLRRMRDELDQYFEQIKEASAIISPAPLVEPTSSTPISPGPIESAS